MLINISTQNRDHLVVSVSSQVRKHHKQDHKENKQDNFFPFVKWGKKSMIAKNKKKNPPSMWNRVAVRRQTRYDKDGVEIVHEIDC